VADFYRGKTIRIVLGLTPGSGADLTARLVAKYLPKYVPGNPGVIVENRPGGGGMLAANTVYNTEPKDGSVIAAPLEGFPLQQLLGGEGVQFDSRQFQWVGSLVKSQSACVARLDSGINRIQDIIGTGKQLIVGSSGPGGTAHDAPTVLEAALNADFSIIAGYPGGGETLLALENKEIDGYCVSFSAMISTARRLIDGPGAIAKIIIILGSETPNHPLLQGVPAAETLATNNEARTLLRVVNSPGQMTRPFAFAPGVPADRVAAVRTAFDRVVADPEFLEEAQRASVDIDANTGEQISQLVEAVLTTPPDVTSRLKQLLRPA
jgi:tripartite-type tricarboxylate transporter receptor subunit TctC